MNTKNTDLLNIGLLLISLVAAFQWPYELFLLAYAVLGPLHYMTEINWLKGKDYFVEDKKWVWLIAGFVVLIVVPKFFYEPSLSSLMEVDGVKTVVDFLLKWSNGFIFLGLFFALTWRRTSKWYWRVVLLIAGSLLAVLFNSFSIYTLIIGLLLPTVIHVFVFTILFMLYGALKNKSIWGYVSVILALLCPVMIVFSDIDMYAYSLSQSTKDIFLSSNFHVTNTLFAKFLGLSEGKTFFFFEKMELKMQIFIAFAYLYHYLNWFSKTTVIGWHKQFTLKKTGVMGAVWLALITLFWYDYRMGFMVALFLSFLHVLLEFPLNMLTIREIFWRLFNRMFQR